MLLSRWAIGALLLVYTALYDATIGPVCYTIVGEISSTRLRAKTVVWVAIDDHRYFIVVSTVG